MAKKLLMTTRTETAQTTAHNDSADLITKGIDVQI